jgi:hypothetical protein
MTSMYQRFLGFFSVVICSAFLGGCGGDSSVGIVSGKVTLDGQALVDGTIAFNSVDGKSPTAGGKITDGNYSVEVPKGAQKVIINSAKVVGTRPAYEGDPNSPVINITEEILPEKYSSPLKTELTVEVSGKSMTKDFPLSSMP